MNTATRLVLIVPVYNFAHDLASTLHQLERWALGMAAQGTCLQILFVDDG